MQPEIHLGPLTLQTFGIMFALGFIGAGVVIAARLREWGKPPDWAYEMIFAGLIGGVVGSRIDFLIQNWDEVGDDLIGNLFSGSGLVWYGGVIGGAIGVMLWARWRGMLNVSLGDLAAVPLALGYAIGRIGCQLSGDGDYGEPWDGPWAMAYPEGTVPTTEEVHPTPVYETLAMGGDRVPALAPARPLPAGDPLRPLPGPRGPRALPGRVRPPQRRRPRRPHARPAREPRDDRRGRGLDGDRAQPPRHAPRRRSARPPRPGLSRPAEAVTASACP